MVIISLSDTIDKKIQGYISNIFELHKFELSDKEKEGFHVNTLEQGGIELINKIILSKGNLKIQINEEIILKIIAKIKSQCENRFCIK